MHITVVAFQLAVASAAVAEPRNYDGYTFDVYRNEFYKISVLEDEMEYSMRKQLFELRLTGVIAHNARYSAGDVPWFQVINRFADRTEEELNQLRGRRVDHSKQSFKAPHMTNADPNPAAVDWRNKSVITRVKDQRSCGSCWAFSATSTVESYLALAGGGLVELSPQSLVSCVQNPQHCGGSGGCEGATPALAFNLTAHVGIPLESGFPYTGKDDACVSYQPYAKANGFVKLPKNNAETVETVLATVGPVSISVATAGWFLYGGGIFAGCTGDAHGSEIDHAVQLVGYTKDYWIVRNSWGAQWGEDGYIRITRTNDHVTSVDTNPAGGNACLPYPENVTVGGECGILYDVSYPTGVGRAPPGPSPPGPPTPPPTPPPQTHYGKPPCLADEVKLEVHGNSSTVVCAPACEPTEHLSCPLDLPEGAGAYPHCGLHGSGVPSKYCALMCVGPDACQLGASCVAGEGPLGVCAYVSTLAKSRMVV